MKINKAVFLILGNLVLYKGLILIYQDNLNHIAELNLAGNDEVLRNVAAMRLFGDFTNNTLLLSAILLILNMFLMKNWLNLNHWLILPISWFIILSPIVIYVGYLLALN